MTGGVRFPQRTGLRPWLAASLRELLHPLVVAYVAIALGVDALHLYTPWPALDVPMHYGGALLLTWFVHRGVQHAMRFAVLPALDWFPRALAIFSLVCTASLFWELGEFLSDRYLGTHAQSGLPDTMSDLAIDMLGALTFIGAWTVLRRRRVRTAGRRSVPLSRP